MDEKDATISISRVSSLPMDNDYGSQYILIDALWRDDSGRAHGATIRMSIEDFAYTITGQAGRKCKLKVV